MRNLEAVFDAEIAPLMNQVFDRCRAHGIPLIAAFQISGDCVSSWAEIPDTDEDLEIRDRLREAYDCIDPDGETLDKGVVDG